MKTIRSFKWKIYQMDAKFTFLNGIVKEEVYEHQSQGFDILLYNEKKIAY